MPTLKKPPKSLPQDSPKPPKPTQKLLKTYEHQILGLDIINDLRPVTYKWDNRTKYDNRIPDGTHKESKLNIGLIAQEVETVEKANGYGSSNDDSLICNLTEDGMSYGMKYERLVPILVNAIKELSARVKTLEAG